MEVVNSLSEIKDGKAFKNVECVLVDFKKSKDIYDITLQDKDTRKSAYLRANLYSFDQMKEMKGKSVLITGLHEPGMRNVQPEKIKIKNIEIKSAEEEDVLQGYLHLDNETINQLITQIKKYISWVGKEVMPYRRLLECFYTDANIEKMKTMPATHIRQGSPLGGMLHATVMVTELAYSSALRYIKWANGVYSFGDNRSINWDLLLTAGLLHLAGNFIYYGEDIPHKKTDLGVEQGFSNCRQQYLLKLAIINHINISDDEMGALLGTMARLNEQKEGIQKCRHEAYFLENAYNLFQQMDSYDAEITSYVKAQKEKAEKPEELETAFEHHIFLEGNQRYVSKEEIQRKAEILGYIKKEEGGGKGPC